eukprot:scaffold21642_cov73-Skeletonema_marinoi.AAC.2
MSSFAEHYPTQSWLNHYLLAWKDLTVTTTRGANDLSTAIRITKGVSGIGAASIIIIMIGAISVAMGGGAVDVGGAKARLALAASLCGLFVASTAV